MSSLKEGKEIEHKHTHTHILYTHTYIIHTNTWMERNKGQEQTHHNMLLLSYTGTNPIPLLPTWNRKGEEKMREKEEA